MSCLYWKNLVTGKSVIRESCSSSVIKSGRTLSLQSGMDDKMEETLEEEQEAILLELSQILPVSSSQETVLAREDLEKIPESERMHLERNESWGMEASAATEEKKERRKRGRPRNSFKKARRERKKGSRTKSDKPGGETKEEIDSGFATSSEQLPKGAEETRRKPYPDKETVFDPIPSDSEGSFKSVESLDLLQTADVIAENGRSTEPCMNISKNMKLYPSIGEGDEAMKDVGRVDKSVQTVYRLSSGEEYVKKKTDFLSSIIKLRHISRLKRDVSAKSYAEILNNSYRDAGFSNRDECERMDVEEAEDLRGEGRVTFSKSKKENPVSHETINYIMRATNAEYVMLKSVQSILGYLKSGLDGDCGNLCDFWRDPGSSPVCDVIIEALDSDPGFIRNKVSRFLKGIFDEISSREIAVEDPVKEYKTRFLSGFCKSLPLSFDLAGHVMEKLEGLARGRPERKTEEIAGVKASYFALRLLAELLRTVLDNIREREIEEVFGRESREAQHGVLDLWKRCWRNPGESPDDVDGEKVKFLKYLGVVGDWCGIADRVLEFSVDSEPLLSSAAEKCSLLTREIFSKMENAIGRRGEEPGCFGSRFE